MRILASPALSNEKINPYNALLYRELNHLGVQVEEYSHQKALLEKFDILHFHWPDGYINQASLLKSLQRIMLLALVILVAKAKGTRIIWTVHNVAPHDAFRPQLSGRFMHWFIQVCNGFIFMSEESKATFFSRYNPPKDIHYAIIPHGHYRNSYPAAIDKDLARTALNLPLDKKILLFFGMIKPYKNIDTLISKFSTTELMQYSLVIAGNPDSPELATQLKALAADNPDIYLFLKFIPDHELSTYLSAADAVILPYKTILNSGALLLALSFNQPVIAPHIGAFVGLQQQLGRHWVNSYDGDLEAETLRKAVGELETLDRPATCPLDDYNWDRLAAATLKLYQRV